MISGEQAVEKAAELMMSFAERTGLTSKQPKRRYLWTDAFAVCNFLDLARAANDVHFTELALRLVDQLHHELGRHRADDARTGWISGLGEVEGESHPTRGGLRIGKKLPERSAGEPFDEQLEWDRDGQYFHYLTRWMHALDRVARSTGQAPFCAWARELAEAAHAAFVHQPARSSRRRMVWKMSIDLSRPLIDSMGQHDPLDGLVTYIELATTASMFPVTPSGWTLEAAAADFAGMIESRHLATADPLGLGGLLMDACRVAQLMKRGVTTLGNLFESLLGAALEGLPDYVREGDWREPASQRLAFRELGLIIGLSSVERLAERAEDSLLGQSAALRAKLDALTSYAELASTIGSFWLNLEHRQSRSWSEHRDINEVMLATALLRQPGVAASPSDWHA